MESQGIFSKTFSILEKSLDLRSIKHNLIVSNIANMDTPNYKGFDLIVEEEFEKALRAGKNIEPEKTQPMHFPFREIRQDNIEFKAIEASPFIKREDGNTVDMDKSMAKLSENTLMYNASAKIIAKKFQGLKNVIQGGGR